MKKGEVISYGNTYAVVYEKHLTYFKVRFIRVLGNFEHDGTIMIHDTDRVYYSVWYQQHERSWVKQRFYEWLDFFDNIRCDTEDIPFPVKLLILGMIVLLSLFLYGVITGAIH